MSDTINILLGKAKSADSVNENSNLNLDFTQNVGPLLDNTIVGTVDLNERFIRERDASTKYRLILTVNPFCSNILYNACSEFIKDEGSDDVQCVTLDTVARGLHSNQVLGKYQSVNSYDMIRNSEYSRELIGFDYHPGMDFFNNHILRNKSYRIVNRYANSSARDNFNTIEDLLRLDNGKNLQKCCRKEVGDTSFGNKHLYDHDDILEFGTGDAVNENIREKDGWFGFYNTNVIPAKDRNGNDMDISRAINSKGNCEFVDMYPDRTLYSFVPKYNKFRNRMEANWDYQLTYPYDKCVSYQLSTPQGDKDVQFSVVQDGDLNALIIISCEYVMGPQGTNVLLFRTATKHNLHINEHVKIYYNEEEVNGHWHSDEISYSVAGLGNMKGEYTEYYFYISDTNLLEQIFATPKDHDGGTYTAWDYVRDYFYKEVQTSDIPTFDPDGHYYENNLVVFDNKIYICVIEYSGTGLVLHGSPTGPGSSGGYTAGGSGGPGPTLVIDPVYFQLFNDTKVEHYSTLGLTNIPSVYDYYIKVDNKVYELYNHDIDIPYHTSSMDPNAFIRQIINNAFKTGDNTDIAPAQSNSLWRDYISFRFIKTDGRQDCSYYIRKFKKVPNMKNGTNPPDNKVDSNFECTSYPLAFANTIYGDQIAQSVFTDTINIEGLKGADGQDIREIFVTIIKANRGYKEWYLNKDTDGKGKGSPAVEFSHCFGPVTCGFDLFELPSDSVSIKLKLKELTDVRTINNDVSSSQQTLGDKTDITIDDEWYYGDIVEFCPWQCIETTLADVNFRFNTAQRDLELENDSYCFQFDEIMFDDYDYEDFKVSKYSSEDAVHRIEGYYYKPHYPIKLRGYSGVKQGSHNRLSVYSAEPIALSDMYIKVTTSLKHGIYGGRVLLRDEANGMEWWLKVYKVVDRNTFIMEKISRTEPADRWRDWITICNCLNDGTYKLFAENQEIPSYATKFGRGSYLWRKTVLGNDIENVDDEIPEYVFANGHHYVDKVINFYLKRQDPEDSNDLYFHGKNIKFTGDGEDILGECVADVNGVVKDDVQEFEYKNEKMTLC